MNKIVIVDDHSLFREGIKLLIENEGLGKVIAEAENGQEFLDILKVQNPDLVIMNMEIPIMGGLEATKNALKMRPDLKILVLTMLTDMANYLDILNAGARGIILKTSGKTEFEKSIKIILSNENYYSYELLKEIMVNFNQKSLPSTINSISIFGNSTNREKEVMEYS